MDESLQFRIQGFSLAVCRFRKGFILSALQRIGFGPICYLLLGL